MGLDRSAKGKDCSAPVADDIPAYGLARLIRAKVFGASFGGSGGIRHLVLVVATAMAIYTPARLKIDPIAALRQE